MSTLSNQQVANTNRRPAIEKAVIGNFADEFNGKDPGVQLPPIQQELQRLHIELDVADANLAHLLERLSLVVRPVPNSERAPDPIWEQSSGFGQEVERASRRVRELSSTIRHLLDTLEV